MASQESLTALPTFRGDPEWRTSPSFLKRLFCFVFGQFPCRRRDRTVQRRQLSFVHGDFHVWAALTPRLNHFYCLRPGACRETTAAGAARSSKAARGFPRIAIRNVNSRLLILRDWEKTQPQEANSTI